MAVWLSMDMSYVGAGDYDNTSKVAVNVYVHWDTVSYNGLSPALNVTVDGVTDTTNVSFNTSQTSSGSQNIYSRYWNIGHDSSGSARTVYGSASYATGTASGTVSASASLELDAIDSGDSGGDSGDSGDSEEDDNTGGSGTSSVPLISGNTVIHGQRDDLDYGYSNNIADIESNNAAIIWFTTPEFVGKSISIDVSLHTHNSYMFSDIPVNVAICTSDANYQKYNNTIGAVEDEYQLTVSSINMSMNSYNNVNIPTTELKSNTDYYLVLWGASETVGLNYVNRHEIKVNYISNELYIDNGSALERYRCYIDTLIPAGSGILTEECTILGSRNYYDASYGDNTISVNADEGYGYIKFRTPSSVINCSSVSVKLYRFYLSSENGDGWGGFSIASSEKGDDIASYSVDPGNYSSVAQTFNISLQPDTEYFIKVSCAEPYSDGVGSLYTSGEADITVTGTNAVDITRYMLYAPYIDNGTSWGAIY